MMEYSREKLCLYVIGRMCEIIQEHAAQCKLMSRDEYVRLFRGLTTGYFKYGLHVAHQLDMEEERKEIWPEVEKVMDEQLEKARRKCMEKSIVTTGMRSILEPRLKEAGLDYTVKYNMKSIDIKIKVSRTKILEVNIKHKDLNESIDRLINATRALQELIEIVGNNLGLPNQG